MTTTNTTNNCLTPNGPPHSERHPLAEDIPLFDMTVNKCWDRIRLPCPTADTVVSGMACVRKIQSRADHNGRQYLLVDVGHRDGRATLKFWASDAPRWTSLSKGDAVLLKLRGQSHHDNMPAEWSVEEMRVQPPDHPIRDDLLPKCPIPEAELEERWARLSGKVNSAARTVLEVVIHTVGMPDFRRAPTADGIHRAVAQHGLWWQSIEVGEAALALADSFPVLDEDVCTDVLLLSALLKDIGLSREGFVVPRAGSECSPAEAARRRCDLSIQLILDALADHHEALVAAAVPQSLINAVVRVIKSLHAGDQRASAGFHASLEAWMLHHAATARAKIQAMSSGLDYEAAVDLESWYRPWGKWPRYVPTSPPIISVPTARTLPRTKSTTACEPVSQSADGAPPAHLSALVSPGSSVSAASAAQPGGKKAASVVSKAAPVLPSARVLPFASAKRSALPAPKPSEKPVSSSSPARATATVPQAIGLPVPSRLTGGRINIALQEQDLSLLLVSAGLTASTPTAKQTELAQRLVAIGKVLIAALDEGGQASIRTSIRELRVVGSTKRDGSKSGRFY